MILLHFEEKIDQGTWLGFVFAKVSKGGANDGFRVSDVEIF